MKSRAFNPHRLSFWYHGRLKGIFCFALREPDQAPAYRVQSEFQGFYFSYDDRSPVQKEVKKCSYLRKEVWFSVYREKLTVRALGSCYYITLWLWARGFTSVFHPTHLQHFQSLSVRWYFIVIYKMLRDRWRFNHPKINPTLICSEGAEEGICVRAGRKAAQSSSCGHCLGTEQVKLQQHRPSLFINSLIVWWKERQTLPPFCWC